MFGQCQVSKNGRLSFEQILVNQKGLLTGKIHFQGITLMQQLLENEGIVIENNQIVDLEKYLWEPSSISSLLLKEYF